MNDEVVHFGPGDSLVGILRRPTGAKGNGSAPAVLLTNSGIVHRVGPHRLYVNLAERLADLGHPVLRFDLSGIGDSATRDDRVRFGESSIHETQDAMSHLHELLGVERFVVSGICSGAQVAFETARRDERVVGAVPINAGLHLHPSADTAARTEIAVRAQSRHFWRIALRSSFRRKNWRKALTGELDVTDRARVMLLSLIGTRKPIKAADDPAALLRSLDERGLRLLHVYSEGDEWLDYFLMFLRAEADGWTKHSRMRLEIVRGADHTFTMRWSQTYLMDLICEWMQTQPWST